MPIAMPVVSRPAPRLARLDGLRGVAAFLVAFAYHGQFLFVPGQFAGEGVVTGWLHATGWAFVDLFFVLSGYVFAHVYLTGDALRTRADVAEFAVARVARLYPLHLVMLLATALFVLGTPGNGWPQFVANLVMLQAFVRPFAESFDGPSWSLSVEAFCYALFAAGALAGRRVLLAMTVALVALNGWRLGWLGQPGGPYVTEVVPRGLLGFFMGQGLWHLRGVLAKVPGAILGAVVVLGVAATALPLSPLAGLTLLAWPAALLLALRMPVLGSAVMVWLGDRSYAIYLINMPLVWAATALFGPLQGGTMLVLGAHLALVAVTLLLADLSLRLVENPARRAIRGWWQQRKAAQQLAIAPALP